MSSARVLIADGDERAAELIAAALAEGGHESRSASDAGRVLEQVRVARYDLLFLDLELAGEDGVELLQRVKQASPTTLVVLTGAGASPMTVIDGFRGGAYDFLMRPVSADAVRDLAARAHTLREKGEQRRLLSEQLASERHQVMELKRLLAGHDPFEKIIGTSSATRTLIDTLREIARTDSTVLLHGESGTGKGLAARAIHHASERREGPFVEANCVVYSEGVLHSELFGHEKGAFTGAANMKRGRFELARAGTLFLDEIGEITPATQVMLLRVLQDRTFERVGGEETLETDVRLIAATNRDLQEAMLRGEFRRDLFFRLNVIPVQLPALREHIEDVPVLAQHFLRDCVEKLGRAVEGFSAEAMDALMRYAWPGNTRELENVIERMVVLCRSNRIGAEDLPPMLRDGSGGTAVAGTLRELERRRIEEVMRETGGNKKLSASRLGIHRSTLYAKLERHGLGEGTAARREERQGVADSATDRRTARAGGS